MGPGEIRERERGKRRRRGRKFISSEGSSIGEEGSVSEKVGAASLGKQRSAKGAVGFD